MNQQKKNIHFEGLTELRGLAALLVIISHIDQFSSLFGYESFGFWKNGMANDAVTLFFVLSGFLITFLLINEKKAERKINIKNFYIRRILRIWPVYFISLILACVILYCNIIEPPKSLKASLFLYFLFLPNVAYVFQLAIRVITPLWSVGVEEQFYLIWPWVIEKFKTPKNALYCIVAIYMMIKITVWVMHPNGGFYQLILLTRIDSMAIGGLFAYWLSREHQWLTRYSKAMTYTSLIIAILFIVARLSFIANLEIEIKSIVYAFTIIGVINKSHFRIFKNSFFRFFGKISYGMYCYHLIVFFVVNYTITQLALDIHPLLNIAITLAFLILVAQWSYRKLEIPLLSKKHKYSTFVSNADIPNIKD